MNNKSAFPTSNWTQIAPMSSGYDEGMQLRDYFAAKAMQALIQHHYFDVAAKKSYEVADAMMKAREA